MNTWNISGMFIALWPITAKIRTSELATKPQTVIDVLACRLVFSRLIVFFLLLFIPRNTITFQKYFWCSRFSRFDCKLACDQAPYCGQRGKKSALVKKKKKKKLHSACFARRYFFLFDPVFCLFPQCGAWSQANCDPRSFFTIRSQRHLLLTPEYKKDN